MLNKLKENNRKLHYNRGIIMRLNTEKYLKEHRIRKNNQMKTNQLRRITISKMLRIVLTSS